VKVVEAFGLSELARRYGIRTVPAFVFESGASIIRDANVPKLASLLFEMATGK
jgi:predicted DsbA family dithiol-disulfide isomerase